MAGRDPLPAGSNVSLGDFITGRDPLSFLIPPTQQRGPSQAEMQGIPDIMARALPVLPDLAAGYGYEQIGTPGGSVSQTLYNPGLASQYGAEQIGMSSPADLSWMDTVSKSQQEAIGTGALPGGMDMRGLGAAASLLQRQQPEPLPAGGMRQGNPRSVSYDSLASLLAPKMVGQRKLSLL